MNKFPIRLGCVVTIAIFSLVGVPAAVAVPSTGSAATAVSAPTSRTLISATSPREKWLRLSLGGDVAETARPFELFSAASVTLKQVSDRLQEFAKDKSVTGILLDVEEPMGGFAQVEEMRAAIQRFRASGKKAWALIGDSGTAGYLVASACDRVAMAPSAALLVTGIHAEALFFKDLFDRIGVQGEFISCGQYKAAAEPMTRSGWSPAARANMESLVDSLYERLLKNVSDSRGITAEEARAALDEAPLAAADALRLKMVDEIGYAQDVVAGLEGREDKDVEVEEMEWRPKPSMESMNPFSFFSMLGAGAKPAKRSSFSGDKIAVIYATGMIIPYEPEDYFISQEAITPGKMIENLKACEENPSIRAIILRIDSGGGDAYASDVIWREVRRVAGKKPVVASLGDVAASGGYYIAMAADRIVAQPSTITGSIGVLGGKISLQGAFGKAGIATESVSRGRNAGMFTSVSPLRESERQALTALLNRFYGEFVAKAAESRHIPSEEIEKAAQGRVWTGAQALDVHLIDRLGGMDEAVAAARELAGIPAQREAEVIVYPEQDSLKDFFQKMFGGASAAARILPGTALLPRPFVESAWAAFPLLRSSRPLALMPFLLDIR